MIRQMDDSLRFRVKSDGMGEGATFNDLKILGRPRDRCQSGIPY
jgi:hypothetical protein